MDHSNYTSYPPPVHQLHFKNLAHIFKSNRISKVLSPLVIANQKSTERNQTSVIENQGIRKSTENKKIFQIDFSENQSLNKNQKLNYTDCSPSKSELIQNFEINAEI